MQPRTHFIAINGLRLHYLEWGAVAAPPILLLHGGSAHAHWWDAFAASVADSYRVLAIDLRGHGDSAHPAPPAYRIDDYAADVAAFVSKQGLDRCHLIGHSLGGMVAVAYARQTQRHLRSLIVVDSRLKVTEAGARYMSRLRNFPMPVYRDREQAIRRFRLLPTNTTAEPELLAHVAAHGIRQLADGRWTLKFDRESFAHAEPQDLTSTLECVACPILIVRGVHSSLLSAAGAAVLAAAAPHAAVAEIADAHHHVMLDNPIAFARAVRGFLAGVGTSVCSRTLARATPSDPP